MNARIKELAEQASKEAFPVGSIAWMEKFAELIICEYSYDVMDLTAAPEHVAMAARHWGVEL